MKKLLLLLPLLWVISCGTDSNEKNFSTNRSTVRTTTPVIHFEDIIENRTGISVETIAFDEEELLPLKTDVGSIIGYYQRIPNPNFAVQGAKIFNSSNEHIYTILPSVSNEGTRLDYKNSAGDRGFLLVNTVMENHTTDIGGFASIDSTIIYRITTDSSFFDTPLTFNMNYETITELRVSMDHDSFSATPDMQINSLMESFYSFDSKIILGVKDTLINEKQENQYFADSLFLQQYPDLTTSCIISLVLLKDTQNYIQSTMSSNNSTGGTGPQLNFNGTIDMNGIPTDNF